MNTNINRDKFYWYQLHVDYLLYNEKNAAWLPHKLMEKQVH